MFSSLWKAEENTPATKTIINRRTRYDARMQGYDRWARFYDLFYQDEIDYDAQCDVLKGILDEVGVPVGGRILDLGCGTGGHAIPLARMGYRVTGIDISKPMTEIAAEKAGDLPVEFLHQDMRSLNLPDRYDAVVCMFGGFGHITELADVMTTLRGISSSLLPERPFIFEYWAVGGVKPGYRGWLVREDAGLKVIRLDQSSFDSEESILRITYEFVVLKGERVSGNYVVDDLMRIYEKGNMEDLLRDAGFRVKTSLDGDGLHEEGVVIESLGPPTGSSFRILTVALKH